MANDLGISLEETNALRKQLGLKPILVESAKSEESDNGMFESKQLPNTEISLETTQFIEADKVSLLRKKLGRLNPKNNNKTSGGIDGDQSWLDSLGKRSLKPEKKLRMKYEEEDEEADVNDLPMLKTSYTFEKLQSKEQVILTLKESTINNDDQDDDILENEKEAQERVDSKNIQLKQMNRDRRQKKMKLHVSSLDFKDENENSDSGSVLLIGAQSSLLNEVKDNIEDESHSGRIKVKFEDKNISDNEDDDDKAVKIKKRKRKDINASLKKRRIKLPTEIRKVALIDEDAENDDFDDFSLSRNVKRKAQLTDNVKTSENIALEIEKEKLERRRRLENISQITRVTKGLIVDEGETFFDSLKPDIIDMNDDYQEIHKTNAGKDDDTGESEQAPSLNVKANGTAEVLQPDFHDGLASTLKFLQTRNVLPKKDPTQQAKDYEVADSAAQQKPRTRYPMVTEPSAERSKAELNGIAHTSKAPNLQYYNPEIKLVYQDKMGNQLTTKEAYKKLSQKFHGTKSNKKKQAQNQFKIEQRNRHAQLRHATDFDLL